MKRIERSLFLSQIFPLIFLMQATNNDTNGEEDPSETNFFGLNEIANLKS